MRSENIGTAVYTVFVAAYLLVFTDRVSLVKGTSEVSNNYEFWPSNVLGKRAMQLVRDHLSRRQERKKSRSSKQICYDMVGCFPIPRTSYSPLIKSPQSPDTVDTKFLLMTRENRSDLILITYGDEHVSMINSNLRPELPTKIIIHGYKGSGRDKTAQILGNALLDVEDSNVIFVDWEKGATGPAYAVAAANTQLIGRQLAILIMDMVALNSHPDRIHLIGFSLGAHVAGFAGKALKRNNIVVGRITGEKTPVTQSS